MFSLTYDNLADTVSYDRNSKYYKPEKFIQVSPSERMTAYYSSRDPMLVQGLGGMGTRLYSGTEDLLAMIDRLNSDNQFWRDSLLQDLQTVEDRASVNLLSKVLGYNLTNVMANLEVVRKLNPYHHRVWHEYIN